MELARGSNLLNKISEDQSLESVIAELVSKSTHQDYPLSRDYSVFLAIVNAQRATLLEERERLRLLN